MQSKKPTISTVAPPTADELRELTAKLMDNPDLADDLTDEQLVAVRKYMNPYGTIISAEESHANLSIINWRDEFMKRFHMMALTGFMFRMLEEYEDKADIAARTAMWQERINAAAADEHPALEKERAADLKMRREITYKIIERFLARNFEYNPDRHVRPAASGAGDTEARLEIMATQAEIAAAADTSTAAVTPETVVEATRALVATANSALEVIDAAARQTQDEDSSTILMRKAAALRALIKPLGPSDSAAEVLPALLRQPPADTLYNYGRYIANNYKRLRQAYAALYAEQPDIEASVIYYDSFPTEAAARDHRIQHADEFKTEVISVSNNGITMLGPFTENTERIDFYNKNTEIMKRMMDQMESDHKLGKDLMEKKVRRKKAANVKEAGPDAPGLASYARTAGSTSGLGASRPTKEEVAAVADETPDDAIEVEVFYPSADGSSLSRGKFYTQAEAPLHMGDGEFTESYQPKREPGQRIVKSRQGTTATVADVAAAMESASGKKE